MAGCGTLGRQRLAVTRAGLLFGYYSRSFIRQQQNWNASLSPETIEALSPQLRAWLGMEARANVKLAQRLRIHPVATHTRLTS